MIQARNKGSVPPIYDLPVLVARRGNSYEIIGKDDARYSNSGAGTSQGIIPMPRHGGQHSLNPELSMGADPVWVYSRQFMPLLAFPSGSSMQLTIEPAFYEWDGQWKYAQNSGTPSFAPFVPSTTSDARMALLYIEGSTNSLKIAGGALFSGGITDKSIIANYIPDIPRTIGLPLFAVKLTSGTSSIDYTNMYDMRDFYTVGIPSGASVPPWGGFEGRDEGVSIGTGTVLNATGDLSFTRSGTVLTMHYAASPFPADGIGIMGQDEGVPIGTGTVLNVTGDLNFSRVGNVFTLHYTSSGAVVGGGGGGVTAWDEGVPLGTGSVFNFTGAGVTATISGSVINVNVPSSGSSNNRYYQYLAASLEPDAIYPMFTSTFNYTVTGSSPTMLLASYFTKRGSLGRMEVRDPKKFMLLPSGTIINGMDSSSSAIMLNPWLPTYSDAYSKYYDRLDALANMRQRQVDIEAAATKYPFLMGAYGGIITRVTCFDYDYIGIFNGVYGINLMNEENDNVTQREDSALTLAVNKFVAAETNSGAGASGKGTVVFSLCPSDWSVIPDNTAYAFRDDFMGPSLSKWSITGSAVQLNTTYQWVSASGTTTWGANGIRSNTSVARASGTVFVIDVYTGRNATANNSHIVGLSDGGYSFSNFSHGVLFTSDGANNQLSIYENGNNRGNVGNNPGYSAGIIYRVRITVVGNGAKYEIQGSEYGAIGGANWRNITPGTTSSSTTPLYAGVSVGAVGTMYVSDAKIY